MRSQSKVSASRFLVLTLHTLSTQNGLAKWYIVARCFVIV